MQSDRAGDRDYVILTADGTTTFDAMAEALSQADVVFLGEQHDHGLGHRLELEILRALHARRARVALSMEMFERDVQIILDEYLAGHITESAFLQAARPWSNYRTDYRPLVEFCREQRLPVIAANAPRRYVNMVSRKGQEALMGLPRASREWLPGLPYAMDIPATYARQLEEIFRGHGSGNATGAAGGTQPSTEYMKQAQGLWDETMKDSILRFLRRHRGWLVLQINGAMHSDSGFGIVDRLRRAAPRLKVAVVSIRPDAQFPAVDARRYAGIGDFVILTREEPRRTPQ